MLTKTTNHSNQKIVNKMTSKVYKKRDTLIYMHYFISLLNSTSVSFQCSNMTVCDKCWPFLVIFAGSCGWLWEVVDGCRWLWLVVAGYGWL